MIFEIEEREREKKVTRSGQYTDISNKKINCPLNKDTMALCSSYTAALTC